MGIKTWYKATCDKCNKEWPEVIWCKADLKDLIEKNNWKYMNRLEFTGWLCSECYENYKKNKKKI